MTVRAKLKSGLRTSAASERIDTEVDVGGSNGEYRPQHDKT